MRHWPRPSGHGLVLSPRWAPLLAERMRRGALLPLPSSLLAPPGGRRAWPVGGSRGADMRLLEKLPAERAAKVRAGRGHRGLGLGCGCRPAGCPDFTSSPPAPPRAPLRSCPARRVQAAGKGVQGAGSPRLCHGKPAPGLGAGGSSLGSSIRLLSGHGQIFSTPHCLRFLLCKMGVVRPTS